MSPALGHLTETYPTQSGTDVHDLIAHLSFTKNERTKELPVTHTVVDPEGDLTLVVGASAAGSRGARSIRVSRSAMRRTCRPFHSMLDPTKWRESQGDEVKLPEDSPEAVEIVANIAHTNFKKVPETVVPHTLLQLAILCDKYDLYNTFKPFLDSWLLFTPSSTFLDAADKLFIYYTFKRSGPFYTDAIGVVKSLEIRVFGGGIYLGGNFQKPIGVDGDNTRLYLNPMLTKLIAARQYVVELLKGILTEQKHRIDGVNGCKASDEHTFQCNLLLSGSFQNSLQKGSIDPLVPNGIFSTTSVINLRSRIEQIQIIRHGYDKSWSTVPGAPNNILPGQSPWTPPSHANHIPCDFGPALRVKTMDTINDLQSHLKNAFKTHFGNNAK
ncbi:MAG: hypothetical protein M1831_000563 [Alyxoria varia]|nr:MAG: hypothetical protein M1831_000563 [Alyxoria varia]